jgi:hypothetical protein
MGRLRWRRSRRLFSILSLGLVTSGGVIGVVVAVAIIIAVVTVVIIAVQFLQDSPD